MSVLFICSYLFLELALPVRFFGKLKDSIKKINAYIIETKNLPRDLFLERKENIFTR